MDSAERGTAAERGLPGGREWLALGVVCVLGFVARAWDIGSVGLGQYDEGVYAFSGWGLSDPAQSFTLWPLQERFAPPVFIALVSLAFRLEGGPSDTAMIWLNVLLGTATIPAVWYVGRRWFGAVAGVVAATVVALSEFHIVLSRSGLTDVTFALVFLLAVAAVAELLEGGGRRRAVVAGLLVGLAWNTKYHGWFALVIGAGALAAWWWFGGADRRRARARLADLVLAAVIAGLAYLPWLVHVERQPGSVTGWTSYFAGMLSIRWPQNLLQHIRHQGYLEGPLTRVSVPLGFTLALALGAREVAGRRGAAIAGAAGLAAATLGGTAATMLLALASAPLLLRSRGRAVVWVALGWAALWVAAAPMYRPYFRLILPFLLVAAMLAGFTVAGLVTRATANAAFTPRRQVLAAAVVAALVIPIARALPDVSNPWRRTDGLRETAAQMSAQMGAGSPVTVIGEPTLAFYLQRLGHPAMGDVTSAAAFDSLSAPRFLVTGVYARRAPALRNGLAARGDRLAILGRYTMSPTEIRLLDDFAPPAARRFRAAPDSTYDLTLFSYTAARPVP